MAPDDAVSAETEIAERMFADFNRGGFEAMAWSVHPAVVCVPFAGWPGPKVYRGLEGWAELAAEWTENFDEYGFDLDHVTSIEGGVLVLATARGLIKGEREPINMEIASVLTEFEDGRARSVRWFRSWDEARSAAGITG